MTIKSHKDLLVWQKGMDLVLLVYAVTKEFPKEELYGLVSQMRRAAISIPSNISEGYHRKHTPEFLQFLRFAFGSGAELETQLLMARDLYPKTETSRSLECLEEIQKMLNGLIGKLESKLATNL